MGNDSAPFFLSIGRLDHIKGFDLMIKAMPKIPYNWKYVIVGPDQQNYSIALKKIIFNLGLENRVIITGALPNKLDVQNALNECSFLVVPSYYEAFGQVILEGFLAKKAIIISKGCRISSDISSDIATLVEPNRNELSTACNRYIENKTLTQFHAVQGYNFCIEKFELSNVIQKLINIYIEVLHT
jgi:glycosyltransferase involved in cell wall biosynthesis